MAGRVERSEPVRSRQQLHYQQPQNKAQHDIKQRLQVAIRAFLFLQQRLQSLRRPLETWFRYACSKRGSSGSSLA